MDGQYVVVKDLEYDSYDQLCTVKVETTYWKLGKKLHEAPTKLILSNDEFTFEYDIIKHEYVNGAFKVYTRN